MSTSKIGRNDPCPCGSGKKLKHCCGEQAARAPRPSFDPSKYIHANGIEWTAEHRFVQVAVTQTTGNLAYIWLAHATETGQYFAYVKNQRGVYEHREVPKDRLTALTKQWQEGVTGHVALLRIRGGETMSWDAWRDRATLISEDLGKISARFRASGGPPRDHLYIRGGGAAMKAAREAENRVTSAPGTWGEDIPIVDGRTRLSAATTVDLPANDARWVRLLDDHRIALASGELHWRFFNGQCFSNVEEALLHPARPPHVMPWVGEVIQPNGERFEHAWLVSEHSGGRSMIDLTPIHPDVMGRLVEEARSDAPDDADHDRILDLLVNRTRRHEPLLKTRVIGRAPELWLYEGIQVDPVAYLAEFSRPVDE